MVKLTKDIGYAKLDLAYADPVKNRMIICMEAAWETMHEQEANFATLPEADDADSPWIVDFHDEDGSIVKDRVISAATAEELSGETIEELIRRGNEREDGLTAMIRSLGKSALQSKEAGE